MSTKKFHPFSRTFPTQLVLGELILLKQELGGRILIFGIRGDFESTSNSRFYLRKSDNLKQFQGRKVKLASFVKMDDYMMIITPHCSTSFFTLLWVKKKINTERKVLFILLILQMSVLFSYELGFAALLVTS